MPYDRFNGSIFGRIFGGKNYPLSFENIESSQPGRVELHPCSFQALLAVNFPACAWPCQPDLSSGAWELTQMSVVFLITFCCGDSLSMSSSLSGCCRYRVQQSPRGLELEAIGPVVSLRISGAKQGMIAATMTSCSQWSPNAGSSQNAK